MTIDELRSLKKDSGLSNRELASLSGIPVSTIDKIFSGQTSSPRYKTLQAIEQVLLSHRETPAPYRVHRQGEYTLADYLALPDEKRVELIDGVFYDMSSPTSSHQTLAGFLYMIFSMHIRSHRGSCRAFIAPMDVQLDRDNRTIVQPDVMVVCDRNKITNARIFGAPDFVAEVLSPSTGKKDLTLKTAKYAAAGVREYWCIDPASRQVLVYWFEGIANAEAQNESSDAIRGEDPDNPYPFFSAYSFHDTIPVRIFGGACTVCFEELTEDLDDFSSR